MPADNIVFIAAKDDSTPLKQFADTVIVRLRVRDAGQFLIIGKVVIWNNDGDFQNASARLTTLDGETELDRADVRIGPFAAPVNQVSSPGKQEISLQATMSLPANNADTIIDLRCSTFDGGATEAKLFAVLVGSLQQAGV